MQTQRINSMHKLEIINVIHYTIPVTPTTRPLVMEHSKLRV